MSGAGPRTRQGLLPYTASPLVRSQPPSSASRSLKIVGIVPSAAGPELRRVHGAAVALMSAQGSGSLAASSDGSGGRQQTNVDEGIPSKGHGRDDFEEQGRGVQVGRERVGAGVAPAGL